MSHGDSVVAPPPGFRVIALDAGRRRSAGFENPQRGVYAIQFHPEVRHTVHGTEILENFLFRICGVEPELDDGRFPAARRSRRSAGRRPTGAVDLRAVGRRGLLGHGASCCARRSATASTRSSWTTA